MKRYFVLTVVLISLLTLTTITYASDTIFRNDDFETHNLGGVFPTLSVATFGGVVTADGKGGMQVTSSAAVTGDTVTVKDRNNNDTKAVKISCTTKVNSIFQFLTDTGVSGIQTYNTDDIYIYHLSLKGDSTNNMNYVEIGKARLYMATGRIDMLADATASPAVVAATYNDMFNSTGAWFDFTYIIDKPSDTVKVYIDNQLKITQQYGGIFNKLDSVKNSSPRVYVAGATSGGNVYIDNVLAYSIHTLDYATNLPSTEVELDKEIKITFNSPVEQSSIDNVSVSNLSGIVELESKELNNNVLTIKLKNDMEVNTSYTIDLSQVKSTYNFLLSDAKKTVTYTTISRIIPIVVKEPLFYKTNISDTPFETQISTLQTGLISAGIQVDNKLLQSKAVTVISVLRKNGVVQAIAYQQESISANGSKVFKCGFNILNSNDCSIDVFVWDSITGSEQLGEKYTFDESGVTKS